jgi:hypothetical protein
MIRSKLLTLRANACGVVLRLPAPPLNHLIETSEVQISPESVQGNISIYGGGGRMIRSKLLTLRANACGVVLRRPAPPLNHLIETSEVQISPESVQGNISIYGGGGRI